MAWSLTRTTSPKNELVNWHQVIRWDESQTLMASLNSATALVLHSVCTLFINKSQHVSKYYHLVSPPSIGRLMEWVLSMQGKCYCTPFCV